MALNMETGYPRRITMSKHYSELKKLYEHALDRMYNLYKFGLEKETELQMRVVELECGLSAVASMCAHEPEVIKLITKLKKDNAQRGGIERHVPARNERC